MSSNVKYYKVNWNAIYDLLYVFRKTLMIRCTVYEIPLMFIYKFKDINVTERLYTTLYGLICTCMCHSNVRHSMQCFGDISQIDHKWDLSDLDNDLYSDSTIFIFRTGFVYTPRHLHDINLGSTSLLLHNIYNYGKMGKTWPFWPWKWPFDKFNQIHHLTVDQYHP